MRTITTPDWLKKLPGNAYLNSQEIVRLFGYSEKTKPGQLVNAGSIPKPSRICEKSFHKNLMWQVSEVREFIKQSGEVNGNQSKAI